MREQVGQQSDGRSDFLPLTFHVPISVALGGVGDDCVLRGVEVLGADVLGEAGAGARVLAPPRRLRRHSGLVQRARLRPAGARAARRFATAARRRGTSASATACAHATDVTRLYDF